MKITFRSTPWWLVMGLLAVVIGCSGGGTGNNQGAFCEATPDCMIGLVCTNNACSLPDANPCEPACSDTQTCFNGACVDVVDNADKDADGSPVEDDCDDTDRTIHPDAFEICDGLDNNCDGAVDEGCPACDAGDVRDCGDDVGTCLTGTQTCVGGAWQACTATRPTFEVCDELDNDCDGLVDETCPCLDGEELACGFDGEGCAPGAQQCADGAWGECLNGVLPTEELCDGRDNDCDGLTDEGYQLGTACESPGECGPGELECFGEHETGCSTGPGGSDDGSAAELCNGLDDDCDGETDEEYADVGTACDGDDTDLCANGIWECDPDGAGLICGAELVTDIEELCNDLDDDCDGLADEDFGVGVECVGLGGCGDGVGRVECAGEHNVRCSTNPGGSDFVPRDEVCDRVDNDCDGETDEDFALLDMPCDGEDTDFCETGTWTCMPSLLDIECVNEDPADNGVELCNNLDDDCDGDTDEDFPLKHDAVPCDLPDDDDICFNGVYACRPDGLAVLCFGDNPSAPEICNNADEDCDNIIDEVDNDGDGDEACAYNYVHHPDSWDCCDSNDDVHPGAGFHVGTFSCNDPFTPLYYPAGPPHNRDWNCNGLVEKEIPDTRVIRLCIWPSCTISTPGWGRALWEPMPGCGETEWWITSCEPFSCVARGYQRTQRCK